MLKYLPFACLIPFLSSLFGSQTGDLNRTRWHVPIGVGVLLLKNDHVFMLKRAYKDWGFGVIAGELSQGETLRQAAARHAAKETGVTTNEDDLNFLCVVHYKTENTKESPLVFFFTTKTWTGEPFNKEPERHSEARWLNLYQLPDHLAPGENLVLEAYKNPESNQSIYLECGWIEPGDWTK